MRKAKKKAVATLCHAVHGEALAEFVCGGGKAREYFEIYMPFSNIIDRVLVMEASTVLSKEAKRRRAMKKGAKECAKKKTSGATSKGSHMTSKCSPKSTAKWKNSACH